MKTSPHSQAFTAIGASLITAMLWFTALSEASAQMITVTAGELHAVGNSSNSSEPATLKAKYGIGVQPNGQGSIYQVLDLGETFDVLTISIFNRTNASTNYGVNEVAVWVAMNEDAPDFDPFDIASYTQVAFTQGTVSPPANNSAGIERMITLEDAFSRQYFMIEFTSTIRQATGYDPAPNPNPIYDSEVHFSDIKFTYQQIPEPSSIVLCGAAAIAPYAIRRRR